MVDAYSTTTLTETAVVDSSTNSTWVGNHAFVTGRLKISADGTQLYSTIAGGVNVYNVSSTANVFAWNVGTGGSWGDDRQLDGGRSRHGGGLHGRLRPRGPLRQRHSDARRQSHDRIPELCRLRRA